MRELLKIQWLAVLTVLFSLGLVSPANAAELSADMIQTFGAGQTSTGKIFIKGTKHRNEINSPEGKHITIMDSAAKKYWVLMPDQKMYMEMQPTGAMAAMNRDEKEIETMADRKLIGTEKIDGYDCEKWLYTYKDKKMGTTTQWISKEIGFPIRTVYEGSSEGKMVMELKNIKTGGIPDSTFSIPAGYKKMQMPGMPGGMPSMPSMDKSGVSLDEGEEEVPVSIPQTKKGRK